MPASPQLNVAIEKYTYEYVLNKFMIIYLKYTFLMLQVKDIAVPKSTFSPLFLSELF